MEERAGIEQDVRVVQTFTYLTRMQALRRPRPDGHTVQVQVLAHHEGLPEKIRYNLWFEDGRLTRVSLGEADEIDVVVACEFTTWADYLAGALSIAEAMERGRLDLDGSEEMIERAVAELGSEESRAALELADREWFIVRLALMRQGKLPKISDPDALIRRRLAPQQEEEFRLTQEAWNARTRGGTLA